MDNIARIKELIAILNKASDAYYNDRDEIMSNYEWDEMYDELTRLEAETGYIDPDSPTNKTGAEETTPAANRETHEYPALSLAKSKDVNVIRKWAGDRALWLSWKMDGLTLVLTYDDGKLTKIMTRGNGTTGSNITYFADYIKGYPKNISDKGHLVVRGEAVISYTDFNTINSMIDNPDEQYANPRNLVSGTLGLDISRAKEVEERCVTFSAFTLVHTDEEILSWGSRMDYLKSMGFNVVDKEATDSEHLQETIDKWTAVVRSGKMDIPVDGLVVTFDDTEYASTGSVTGHHATNAGMAFKWQDTEAETTLDHIEWSCAAFAISPVAVFDPVSLEGTTVTRASLCNISEMKRLGIGADRVTSLTVIKSNMIIPKCVRADAHGTSFIIPDKCPVCNAPTEIVTSEKTGTETLHCTNPDCTAKHIQKYTRFVSKTGMDIDGLSIRTLMRFINEGYITDFADIYDISEYKDKIIELDGFGEKSFANLIASVDKSRHRSPENFIYALCIPMIGLDAAKKLIAHYGTAGFFIKVLSYAINDKTLIAELVSKTVGTVIQPDDEAFINNGTEIDINNYINVAVDTDTGFEEVDGIGQERSTAIIKWISEQKNSALLQKLLGIIQLENKEKAGEKNGSCAGLTFVITGDVHSFKNRDEFKAYVEAQGGHVAGSVSGKTNYLVNNDINSTSSKNTKAKSLGVEIITEDTFIEKFGI
ncbi:MAG: NAD-dependent DNA ligase LigA [Lachnospiraceae bacterium]|nr:NAD-dependent DNA ligase LigA [Lachnospiraceae bacterium]